MSLLLCFAGQIGSGKSSVSMAVAENLGWRRTSFSDYLRGEIVRSGGDPECRETLQELGQKRVDVDPIAFCRDVLSTGGFLPDDNFVIDGVRHVSIFELLRTISAPTQARLLFLGALETTRTQRILNRRDAADFSRASSHRVEAELRVGLPQRADGIVDANQPLDKVVADCLELVRHWHGQ